MSTTNTGALWGGRFAEGVSNRRCFRQPIRSGEEDDEVAARGFGRGADLRIGGETGRAGMTGGTRGENEQCEMTDHGGGWAHRVVTMKLRR